MLYAIIGMLVIILDQGVKFWVTNNIILDVVTEPLIPGILSLVRLHNDGAAFSFLAGGGARIYFIILTGVFTVAVIIALATNFISGRFGRWCLVLVTAGGLSNCIDRILYGFVVDMFKIDLFDFAVFNVADIFITVFSLLFIFYIIFGGEPDGRRKDEFDDEDDEDLDRPDMRGSIRESMADRKAARSEKAMLAAEKRAAEKRSSRRASKYEEYDEYEEEEAPVKGFGRKKKMQEEPQRRSADRYEEEEPLKGFGRKGRKQEEAPRRAADRYEEEELRGFGRKARKQEEALPHRDKGTSRKDKRKTLYEEDYEQFQAMMAGDKRTVRGKASQRDQAAPDPFAEWEKANARFESRQSSSPTAKAMGVAPQRPAERATERAERPAAQTARAAAPARPTETVRAPRPAAPVVEEPVRSPAPAPAPKPAPAPAKPQADSFDEFSLDDILAEFK